MTRLTGASRFLHRSSNGGRFGVVLGAPGAMKSNLPAAATTAACHHHVQSLFLSSTTTTTTALASRERRFLSSSSLSSSPTEFARRQHQQRPPCPRNGSAVCQCRFQSTAAAAPAVEEPEVEEAPPPFVSTPERKYEYFQNVEVTESGVALIRFDCPGKAVNTISFALGEEAKTLWETDVHPNSSIKAVVFTSAKPDMFVAGADIFDIQRTENKQDLLAVIEASVKMFQGFKSKGVPLVAAIDGPALGGGLEWALWCDYRICTDNSKTKLGLPEVKLGLLPGFGGTQNLPAVVGLQNGMDMMLTGKEVRADKAKKMGLVDLVVAPASLESVAITCGEQLAAGTLKPKRKPKSFVNRLIEDNPVGRYFMWQQVDKMVAKNTAGNYPAPYKIMDCVKYGLEHPKGQGKYKNERENFVRLAETPESEALIGIFDGMTKMKKHPFGDVAHPIETVAVMGAGLMGAGIAQVTSEKGQLNVLLKDRNDESVGRGLTYMQDNWNKKLSRRRMTNYQYARNVSNVTPLTDASSSWERHFGKADMVIEAVFEDLELKRKIVADMERVTPEHCIFASNTSAIPIRDIASQAARPENIIGMHYFSPVPNMPLLEIIPHEGTSDSTKASAFEVGTKKQGKTCILVKDVPGFYVNRSLGPFMVEVSALLLDGVPVEKLESVMKKFGMPVGPVTLFDEVGLDVASHVANFLASADLGVRMEGGDPTLLTALMDKGWMGKKSGKGFFTYKGKKKTINPDAVALIKRHAKQKTPLKLDEEEIQDRMVCRFVNEAAKCLEDDVIENPVVGDIGLVFGTGFAPFRGGPFRYLDQVGVTKCVDRMKYLVEKYHGAPQFEPCQLLQDYAAADNKKFHS